MFVNYNIVYHSLLIIYKHCIDLKLRWAAIPTSWKLLKKFALVGSQTPVWFQINRCMVNTIWFRFDSIRFRKDFSVPTSSAPAIVFDQPYKKKLLLVFCWSIIFGTALLFILLKYGMQNIYLYKSKEYIYIENIYIYMYILFTLLLKRFFNYCFVQQVCQTYNIHTQFYFKYCPRKRIWV